MPLRAPPPAATCLSPPFILGFNTSRIDFKTSIFMYHVHVQPFMSVFMNPIYLNGEVESSYKRTPDECVHNHHAWGTAVSKLHYTEYSRLRASS